MPGTGIPVILQTQTKTPLNIVSNGRIYTEETEMDPGKLPEIPRQGYEEATEIEGLGRKQVNKLICGINNKITRNAHKIRVVDINPCGIIRIGLKGVSVDCPVARLIIQHLVLRILKKNMPGIRNVVCC